jgi:signal transduction histidine kinase
MIFDSFSQYDQTTTRKYGGSGLGLAISKKLTNMMHGSLTVESPVNGASHGSSFCFSVELQKVPATEEPVQDTKML